MRSPGTKFFMPCQSRFIQDPSGRILVEKARQIGFSFAASYRLVKQTSRKDWTWDAWISSRDDVQAQLFGQDCKAWAGLLQIAAGDLETRVIDADKQISAHTLPFANGRAINSMSSNPDAQAGKRGTRLLDEFGLHKDPRRLYAIAKPGLDWGGDLIVISTHRGSANFFNELVEEVKHKGNPKGFSLHTITILDAINQGLLEKRKAKWAKDDPRQALSRDDYLQYLRNECPDEETWMQEYMCVPADDNSAFLTYDLIVGCEYRPEEKWQTDLEDAKGQLYVGVDIGRDHDFTAIWVIEKLGDVAHTRRLITLDRQTFDAQEKALYEILRLPQVRRCCIDQTGIGRQFAERAQMRFGTYKVERVQFSGPVKEELAYPVRTAFEDRTVRVPNDRFIRSDLRAIRKETTASGNIRFAADRGKNGHADRFWALALALHGAKRPNVCGAAVVRDSWDS